LGFQNPTSTQVCSESEQSVLVEINVSEKCF
jgi:hypothetical protein